MQENMITITKQEHNDLQEDSAFLNCLRNAGVDSWGWFDFALEEFHALGVKMNKTVYYFRPHLHWNTISKDAYEYLQKFYSDEYLKIEIKNS